MVNLLSINTKIDNIYVLNYSFTITQCIDPQHLLSLKSIVLHEPPRITAIELILKQDQIWCPIHYPIQLHGILNYIGFMTDKIKYSITCSRSLF